MDTVECRELIVSTLKRRGSGADHSPIRVITEVYEKDGTKIAEYDPDPDGFTRNDLLAFAQYLKLMNYDPDKIEDRVINKWLDSLQ